MNPETIPSELIEHLQRISSLDAAKAQQLVEEVLSFYQDSVEQYVARRHRELQLQGMANSQIYALIRRELALRCFAAPALSERQIRRIIYG
ncbi:MAG: hypothetical protein ACPGSM_07170 [Thiolinea sp.]